MVLHCRLFSEGRQRRRNTKKGPLVHQKQLRKKEEKFERFLLHGKIKQETTHGRTRCNMLYELRSICKISGQGWWGGVFND
jgi:hypothetical protein